MPSTKPRVITKSDPSKIVIEWSDDHVTTYTAAQLRSICPCAGCVDEISGVRTHDPATVAGDLTQSGTVMVGHYAISMRFSDGHATGIYPFVFLREQDPAAASAG